MKKFICFTILILSVATILVGCSKEVENRDVDVVMDGNTIHGLYTGVLEDRLPSGKGKLVVDIDDKANWIYEGDFSEGIIVGGGTVSNYHCVINGDEGNYDGTILEGKLTGIGAFHSNKGYVYEGNIEQGELVGDGSISSYVCTYMYDKNEIVGIYDGSMNDGKPDGNGKFVSNEPDLFVFEGEWKDGSINEGTLNTSVYTIHFDEVNRTGSYSGIVKNGKADGDGVFEAVNDDGVSYTYSGEFGNGTFNGKGKLEYHTDDEAISDGQFTNGNFTPSKVELLKYIGSKETFISYSVNDIAYKFIEEHGDLFPTEDKDAVSEYLNKDISINSLYKTPGKNSDEMVSFKTSKIIQIMQEDICGYTITWFIAGDGNGNNVFVVYIGELADVNKGNCVNVLGVPIDIGSYKNSFGANNTAYVVFASDVSR